MPDLFRFPFRRAVNFTGSFKVPGSTAALAIQGDMLLEVAAPPSSGSTGIALEASAALPLSGLQIRAVGAAQEAGTALALSGVQIITVGLATEAETAFARQRRQIRATGLAAEAETALNLSSLSTRTIGLAVEVDAAIARPVGALAVGKAAEVDTALPLGSARPVGIAMSMDYAMIPAWTVSASPTAQNIASGFLHPFMKKMAA